MALIFEVGASVMLVGSDLQFIGMADGKSIRFLIEKDALQRLADKTVELSRQETFKVYDRNRRFIQETARRLFEQASGDTKTIKIGVTNIQL